MLTRKMRKMLTALIWTAWLIVLFLQYENIKQVLNSLREHL
jgi:hypothetical protein